MTWAEERDEMLGVGKDGELGDVMEPAGEYGHAKPFNIVERARLFALDIISFSRVLHDARWWSFADQILRSGTSIGANMSEAQQAESRRDFLHKVKIAGKEAKETRFWLSLCRDSPHLPYTSGMYEESNAISAILSSIIARTIVNERKRGKKEGN